MEQKDTRHTEVLATKVCKREETCCVPAAKRVCGAAQIMPGPCHAGTDTLRLGP